MKSLIIQPCYNQDIFRATVILNNLANRLFFSASVTHHGLYNTLHKKWSFPLRISSSKCDQIRSFLWIWSHLMKKSLMENFIFCSVIGPLLRRQTDVNSHKLQYPFQNSSWSIKAILFLWNIQIREASLITLTYVFINDL